MARYQVLQPIEKDGVCYFPKDTPAPQVHYSGGHGGPIRVDCQGIIELTDEQAKELNAGQIPRDAQFGIPLSEELKASRRSEEHWRKQRKEAAEKAQAEEQRKKEAAEKAQAEAKQKPPTPAAQRAGIKPESKG